MMRAMVFMGSVLAPTVVLAQAAPLEDGAGRPPAADVSTDAIADVADESADGARRDRAPASGPVNPSRPTYTDNARFVAPGHLELEAGYEIDFIGCPDPDGSVVLINGDFEASCNLQRMDLLVKYAHDERLEFRAGWGVFGAQGTPIGESESGVGDVFVQGKIGLGVFDEPGRHQLAVLGTLQPGVGQAPIGSDGLTIEAFGVYGFTPGPIVLDAQAGLSVVGIGDDTSLRLPLSAVVSFVPVDAVSVFGELVETLTFDDLNNSETSLLIGAGFVPTSRLALDVAGGIGLSETLPDAILRLGVTVQLGAVRSM